MAIQQKLHTKLVQKLILTPSLQQAIKLLPMSTLELADLLNQEMVENPMLEEIPTEDLQAAEARQTTEEKPRPNKEPTKADTWDDADYEYFFGDYLDDGYRPHTPQEVKELPPIENTLSTTQLARRPLDVAAVAADRRLGDPRDRRGHHRQPGRRWHLVASLDEIAAMGPWPVEKVEQVARDWCSASTRSASPRGTCRKACCCRSGTSASRARPPRASSPSICGCCRTTRFRKSRASSRMPIEELKTHIEIIRHLDPKPGSRFNPVAVPVRDRRTSTSMKVEDQYVVWLNEDGLPQMRISPTYRRLLDKAGGQQRRDARLRQRQVQRRALWLIKSVQQRQKTIYKVARSIINFQREFLDHGIEHLRPLVLRDVANDIGMHESTVSRVVTNKYMHTPQGVFEMKYFFHSGISSSYGESVSSVTIKQRIKKIIESEDPRKPLSAIRRSSASSSARGSCSRAARLRSTARS